MTLSEVHDICLERGQSQLLTGSEGLSTSEAGQFLSQLQKWDPLLGVQQRKLLLEEKPPVKGTDRPWTRAEKSGNREDYQRGEALIREGKVGCLILAGGQGSRLGCEGPKGMFPISPVRGKSLFQLFCERARAAGARAGRPLPLCIMTSPLNHAQTVAFFRAHDNFNLGASQVSFFEQGTFPFLDDCGGWVLERPGKIAEGPDGNGQALRLFFETGLWSQWRAAGIEYLNVIVVDNALADPFDPEFIGYAARTRADAVLKAVERLAPDEQMGVLAERADHLKVIEYSEIPKDAAPFTLSHTGLFCFTMECIRYLYEKNPIEMPLHLARKSAPVLLCNAKGIFQEVVKIWKCETFLFDVLDHVRSSAVLLCPREKVYAPLKNAAGEKSIDTVKAALLSYDRQMYQTLTGRPPSAEVFELDPAFYTPSEEQVRRLSELALTDRSYISAD